MVEQWSAPAAAKRLPLLLALTLAVAGCEEGAQLPAFLQPSTASDAQSSGGLLSSGPTVERDVEAPDVFQVTEAGLWDGRPSLGGVWVAHPDVDDPERVIIRNPTNGQFVIGALFRRERATPGPRLQVSSDAADALDMVAGQPSNLNVTALRRETTPVAQDMADDSGPLDAPDAVAASALDDEADVTAQPLDDVSATAIAALDATPTEAETPAPAPRSAPPVSSLAKPFIQVGIFSVEQNANNTSATMRRAGLVPTIKKGASSGKTFWRVVVGPATSADERAEILKTIKAQGFSDAYAVTN